MTQNTLRTELKIQSPYTCVLYQISAKTIVSCVTRMLCVVPGFANAIFMLMNLLQGIMEAIKC